jgi:hypothetical protein
MLELRLSAARQSLPTTRRERCRSTLAVVLVVGRLRRRVRWSLYVCGERMRLRPGQYVLGRWTTLERRVGGQGRRSGVRMRRCGGRALPLLPRRSLGELVQPATAGKKGNKRLLRAAGDKRAGMPSGCDHLAFMSVWRWRADCWGACTCHAALFVTGLPTWYVCHNITDWPVWHQTFEFRIVRAAGSVQDNRSFLAVFFAQTSHTSSRVSQAV